MLSLLLVCAAKSSVRIRPSSICGTARAKRDKNSNKKDAGRSIERCVGLRKGQRCRLLQLVSNELNEGVHLLILPVDKLVLLLDGEAAFAKGDDVESGVLVSASDVDDVLKKTASLSKEGLCSLLSIGVSTDAADDADSLQVAAFGEQVHARHGSALDIASDGDVQHGLACVITDHADEVESSGSGVETQFEGIENQAGLGSNLDNRD
jgi:hypothetical protein